MYKINLVYSDQCTRTAGVDSTPNLLLAQVFWYRELGSGMGLALVKEGVVSGGKGGRE